MAIICFEGASAVGKTTLSKYLMDKYEAAIVPEVNLLFERYGSEPETWYFEKQIERWQIAHRASAGKLVILDGDPFQPLWYNWAYNFQSRPSLDVMARFYREKLARGLMDFPDKYFILTASSGELTRRKINDPKRTRKNFELHLQFIEPQLTYFKFIKSLENDLVEFIENSELEKSATSVINSARTKPIKKHSSLQLFSLIIKWLGETAA